MEGYVEFDRFIDLVTSLERVHPKFAAGAFGISETYSNRRCMIFSTPDFLPLL
jgi:hypothetical protein